jgi:thiamine biosynthesis protein ThiS
MKIRLNGDETHTQALDLFALVKARNLDPSSLVIEHNHTLVRQTSWAETRLKEGDTIELLSFVGGG